MKINDRITLIDELERLPLLGHSYSRRLDLDESKFTPSSAFGVVCNGTPELVITAAGGATRLNPRSYLYIDDRLYLAIGEFVVCLMGPELKVTFAEKMDDATCFGLLYDKTEEALVVHGELSMTRFAPNGQILWQAGGADVFTGESEISDRTLKVSDFNGRKYVFNLETGIEEMQ